MTVRARGTDARGAGSVPPGPQQAQEAGRDVGPTGVRDLRGGAAPAVLRYPAGDLLVVSGLPGSGKSTLIRRSVAALDSRDAVVWCVDSQDARDRLERRTPSWLPYGVYRPLVRIAHYAGLRRALRSDASAVVHDCGQRGWVRRWLVRDARRRGSSVHLLVLAVDPATALAGQAARGRTVSAYAFGRHRRAMARLVADTAAGRLPDGCVSATLLDRPAARALEGIVFDG
ncbi:AAA family ATPase [Streptomyces netropsis]